MRGEGVCEVREVCEGGEGGGGGGGSEHQGKGERGGRREGWLTGHGGKWWFL